MELYQMTHEYLEYLTNWIEMVGIAVVVWGFLIAVKDLLIYEFSKMKRRVAIHEMRYIRVTLGNYILFGLEFMIASDLIGSILNRSTEELMNLVIIVIVRTTISYFLGKEIADLPPRK